MNKVTKSAIESLTQYNGDPVLTLYIPTHRAPTPPHMQEDQTRFKNLVRKGEEAWKESGDKQKITAIIDQLLAKIDDVEFWRVTTEGLAVFADYNHIELYHLPIECSEKVNVSAKFNTLPLLIVEELNQPYYVFTLAMHNSKLFYGDMYGLEPVGIEFPTSPEDALNIDEMFSNSNTIRGVSTQGGGNDTLSSHGQGDSNHAGQEERLKYFRIIDSSIINSDEVDNDLPVLIAATESEASDYRSCSNIKQLMQAYLPGNHTNDTLPDLHQLTQRFMREEILTAKRTSLIDNYHTLKGAGKSSTDISSITEAAEVGRVDSLILPLLDTTSDSVDDASDEKLRIRYSDEDDESRRASLIEKVLEQGGSVIGVQAELMPDESSLAAIYRY